jgi:hypothetical protein
MMLRFTKGQSKIIAQSATQKLQRNLELFLCKCFAIFKGDIEDCTAILTKLILF